MLRASEALRDLGAATTPGMAEHTPVLSYGSNTSPYGNDRKCRAVYGAGPIVIPAIICDLAGHDVVYSPYFSHWQTTLRAALSKSIFVSTAVAGSPRCCPTCLTTVPSPSNNDGLR